MDYNDVTSFTLLDKGDYFCVVARDKASFLLLEIRAKLQLVSGQLDCDYIESNINWTNNEHINSNGLGVSKMDYTDIISFSIFYPKITLKECVKIVARNKIGEVILFEFFPIIKPVDNVDSSMYNKVKAAVVCRKYFN